MLFGEKIPSKTNSSKSVRKVKFAVIRKWFVEKREKEEAEKAKKAREEEEAKAQKEREAAAKKAKRASKKAADEDKAAEQNMPLEVANNTTQEQLDLAS